MAQPDPVGVTDHPQSDDMVMRRQLRRLAGLANDIRQGGDDRRLAQRTAIVAFAIRVAAAALAYGMQIVLARWIGNYSYGVFAFVWTAIVVFGGLAPLGFPITSQRFPPAYAANGQTQLLHGFLLGTRLFAFCSGVVFAAIGGLVLFLLRDIVDPAYIWPLAIGLLAIPIFAMSEIQDGLGRNWNWIGISLGLPYIARPLAVIGALALLVGLGWAADGVTAVAALVIAIWVIALAQLVLLQRAIKKHIGTDKRAYDWPAWIRTALPILMVEGFVLVLTSADILILTLFASPEEVGIYYATVKTLVLVSFVSFAVVAASAHKFAAYHAAGEHEQLRGFVREAVNWTFWPSLALTGLMLLAGPHLLGLFGPEFVAGYPLMFILAVGLLARATVGPVERLLNMLDQQRACATVYGITFVVNIGLNFALIPVFGPTGAAVATAAAMIIESIFLFLVARGRLGINVFVWQGRRA